MTDTQRCRFCRLQKPLPEYVTRTGRPSLYCYDCRLAEKEPRKGIRKRSEGLSSASGVRVYNSAGQLLRIEHTRSSNTRRARAAENVQRIRDG